MAKTQQQDPVQKQLVEFVAMWRDFFQKLEAGVAAPVVNQEMEDEFLKLSSRIAMRKQILNRLLPDDFTMGDDVMKVLIETPSLDAMQNESPIKINAIKGQWHEASIAMSRLAGRIKERKAEETKKGGIGRMFGR